MRIYPAIRANMGDWSYYIVRMRMREIAHEIQLAHDIYEDQTLSEAVQRALGEKRVKEEIVGYLANRMDRFFSSIVVAAMEGEPAWTPVEMDFSVVPQVFSQSTSLRESFGILSFGEEPKYYALDGQHRVAAIKLLVNGETDHNPPVGFFEDFLSVIVVLREEHDVPEGEWMRRYRRLFSSLNRYAKPTDKDTNIIMDEDDLVAIITRRLITDHEFFKAPGREKESFKVQTKGKNLRSNATHFTTLQTLYEVNSKLLATRRRDNLRGRSPVWYDKQIRPEEDDIDNFYEEISRYWDAILKVLPDLLCEPIKMRQHDADKSEGDFHDHLVFWPIGQELFADIVRDLIDCALEEMLDKWLNDDLLSVDELCKALEPLTIVPWDLHEPPWRHLLLVKSNIEGNWKMRSEDRKYCLEVAYRILRWLLNIDNLDEGEELELRENWEKWLYESSPGDNDAMWNEIKGIREKIISV